MDRQRFDAGSVPALKLDRFDNCNILIVQGLQQDFLNTVKYFKPLNNMLVINSVSTFGSGMITPDSNFLCRIPDLDPNTEFKYFNLQHCYRTKLSEIRSGMFISYPDP